MSIFMFFQVIDTPDISTFSLSEKNQQVSAWKQKTSVTSGVILLAVRCDIRYTAEEYAIYQELKRLWNNDRDFCGRLIVAFTFGDRQDNPLEDELKAVCKELNGVLRDAGREMFCLFNKKADDKKTFDAVQQLLSVIFCKKKVTISYKERRTDRQ
jgi:hypothetical protein